MENVRGCEGVPKAATMGQYTRFAAVMAAVLLAGCAVPTTGVIPRSEGMHTVTRQGNGFWVQPAQLTNEAILEASAYCEKSGKKYKQVHVKEIPAGAFGRWPETELLFRCD